MINVILADHMRIFRIGMAGTLAAEDDIRIVGQPQSLQQLLNGLRKFRAHVLVLSSNFFVHLDEIKQAAAANSAAILFLPDGDDVNLQQYSPQVEGVMHRSADESTIVQCIRCLARGGRVAHHSRGQADKVAMDSVGLRVRGRLSHDELRIISLVVQGYKNREIAAAMGGSEQAVKNILRRVFDKTGVSDRLQLALFVIHHRTLVSAARDKASAPVLEPMTQRGHYMGVIRRPVIN